MTDSQRGALAVLAEVCDLSPDVRLGQLFAHVGFLAECTIGKGLGYIDDDELVAVLYRHKAELVARLQGTPNDVLSPISVSGSPMLPETTQATERRS
ncbi:MAG TPA: hypothetical protein VGY55_12840 [Pirellulales bacterium]|jgi:hypothetical protein|nr:hypothetical protein [Pirellulales bacterium]